VVCRPADLGAEEIRHWHAFATAAGLDHPDLSPEYAILIGDLFPATSRVAVIYDGNDLVGFLPFAQYRFRRAAGIGEYMAALQAFIPSGAPWTFSDVLRAARIDLFEFTRLLGSQLAPSATTRPLVLLTADLSHGYDEYLSEVRRTGGKFIKTAEWRVRRLERDLPDLRFEFGGHNLTVVRQLLDWKSAQIRRAGHWDMFAQPIVREFVERIATSDSPALTGFVSCLRSGDQLLAGCVDVGSQSVLAAEITAYDPNLASRSPGIVCILKMLEEASRSGIPSFQFGIGDQEFKRRLATGSIDLIAGPVGRPSIGTRLSRHVLSVRTKLAR